MKELIKTFPSKIKEISKKDILLIFIIFISGVLSYGLMRFIFIDKNETHYHANFALYINGQKEEFKNFTYYEEISACSKEFENNPKSRVHMHDNVSNIIHVHDKAVTWSNFMENLGFTFGDKVLVTPTGTYLDGNIEKFTFIINGEKVNSIADKVINSTDTLLISYGDEDISVNKNRYDAIVKNSTEYNQKSDPNTCSGGAKENIKDRIFRTLLN